MFLLALVACGPGYLTPEEVRDYIANPTGTVDESSMGLVADDYFAAQQGMGAGMLGFGVQSDQRGSDGGGITAGTALGMGLPTVQKGTAGDVFCVTNLVAQLATYDACSRGDSCDVDLTIDSCLFRVGDEGDELADGKLHFSLTEDTNADFDRGTLLLEFEGWEYTLEDGLVDRTDGILGFEYTDYKTRSLSETILSVDIERAHIDPAQDTLFNNGHVWDQRASAAVMASFEELEDGETASLDILAFTGSESEELDEWVVMGFDYESTWASDTSATFDATMTVTGSNGSFECVWSAQADQDAGTSTYTSEGVCTDEDGDTVEWNNTVVEEG